jgi:hypothetical protein
MPEGDIRPMAEGDLGAPNEQPLRRQRWTGAHTCQE